MKGIRSSQDMIYFEILCSMFNISTFHFTTKNSPIEMEKNLKHVCMFAALGERDLI